ncbi:hypothetical protein [Aeromonas caviae]|uniref:Uncharacterized protein n=1 Tax=Aeromonas caviae TaxID=648 RepID=A0AAJ5ZB06_AERCA|nr:hypothetical protein [Aeromonas caviae]WFG00300.1 hypothetical protein P5S46_21295 [Aeromonas caviae]
MSEPSNISESLLELTRKEKTWRDRVSRSEALLQDRQQKLNEASEKAMRLFGTNDPGELRAIAQRREQEMLSMMTMYDKSITVLDGVLGALVEGKKIPPGILDALRGLLVDDAATVQPENSVAVVAPDSGAISRQLTDHLSDEEREVSESVQGSILQSAPSVSVTPLTPSSGESSIVPVQLHGEPRRLHVPEGGSEASLQTPAAAGPRRPRVKV